jgi:predicted enzyme related to lactoylglutathione lyase
MAVALEFYVELFVSDRARYLEFFQHAFGVTKADPTNLVCLLEAPGLRVLLHEGTSDLPERHFFRGPINGGARKDVGVEICLAVDDLEAVHATAATIPGFNVSPIRLMPWGLKDFRLTTPDNYYFRITEPRPTPV